MRKWILLFMLVSDQASAAWTQVDADAQRTTFADPASIQRQGNVAKMLAMVEFNRFQRMVEVGYFSQKFLYEFDCNAMRARRHSQVFHAGHMGDGSVIYSDDAEQEWESVGTGGAMENLMKVACR